MGSTETAAPGAAVCRSPETFVIRTDPATRAVALNSVESVVPTAASNVWVPASGPSVHFVLAYPVAVVNADALLTLPPPDSTVHLTVAPEMGLPYASLTRTSSESGSCVPATVVCGLLNLWSVIGVPASAVARNLPETSAAPVEASTTRASTIWLSATDFPSVHRSCANPSALLSDEPAKTLPPP